MTYLGAVLASALLAFATVSQADPDATGAKKKRKTISPVKTRTATGTTSQNRQLLSVIATCPRRTALIGGGFNSGIATTGGSADLHVLYEAHRLGRRQWIVSGARLDANSSGNQLDLTSHAQCRARKKLAESTASVPLLGGVLTSATTAASCPGKKRAVSGGFSLTPSPFVANPDPGVILVSENRRSSSRSWTVSASQFSPTQRTLTVFAYCAPGKAPKERSSTAFLAGNTLSTAGSDTPPCPRALRPVSGGFLTAVPSTTSSVGLFVSSVPTGASWHSLAIQTADATGADATTFGYCL